MGEGKTLDGLASGKQPAPVTVRGIAVEGVTPDTLNDFEFLETVAAMSDPDADDAEKLRAVAGICPTVLGRRQWRRVKSELRAANGGKLSTETVMGFIEELMEALNSKNC